MEAGPRDGGVHSHTGPRAAPPPPPPLGTQLRRGFLFSARNFSGCQRLSSAKTDQTRSISRFPTRGGPVGQNIKRKRVSELRGGTFGAAGFPPQSPPGTGKLRFRVFRPGRPELLRVPKAQNGAKATKLLFPADGGPSEREKSLPAKVRKPIPRTAWERWFSISGPHLLGGPPGALRVWLPAAAARTAGTTQVA